MKSFNPDPRDKAAEDSALEEREFVTDLTGTEEADISDLYGLNRMSLDELAEWRKKLTETMKEIKSRIRRLKEQEDELRDLIDEIDYQIDDRKS